MNAKLIELAERRTTLVARAATLGLLVLVTVLLGPRPIAAAPVPERMRGERWRGQPWNVMISGCPSFSLRTCPFFQATHLIISMA
jgi:hypothetical protein